ncbi:MAG: ABC transporter permease, partial [Bacteroidota bacterium]
MLRAFTETFQNLRTNFFQTLLSVLGIIIGVGALVAMLAMIDGLEKFARDRIASGSSLENLMVRAKTGTRVDGIYTERDTIADINEEVLAALLDSLPYPASGQLQYGNTTIGYTSDSIKLGLRFSAVTFPLLEPQPDSLLLHGRELGVPDNGQRTTLVNTTLARRLIAPTDSLDAALGQQIYLFGDSLAVSGVYKDDSPDLRLGFSFSTYRLLADAPTARPIINLALDDVHNVLAAQEFTDGWMERYFADIPDATESNTQTGYLEELAKGVAVFRLVMGFLIG